MVTKTRSHFSRNAVSLAVAAALPGGAALAQDAEGEFIEEIVSVGVRQSILDSVDSKRMADTISYIGRDIEDAIRLDLVSRSDLPSDAVDVLGNTNGTIVYNLVTDVIRNSYRQPYLAFSREVSQALKTLKDFNLEHIYMNAAIKRHTLKIEQLFVLLFNRYMKDLQTANKTSVIFEGYLSDMDQRYMEEHQPAEIVRDFIAGMTDHYFLQQCPQALRPAVEIR